MISKNKIKEIRALERKKNRVAEGLFVAEGPKVVGDLIQRFLPKLLVHTQQWNAPEGEWEDIVVSEEELQRVSFLQHPQQVLAVFRIPDDQHDDFPVDELSLALDGIQDPGNLGTIIRIADWFGIRHVYCSHETADVYNPKVVQAAMGSLARVKVSYVDLKELIASAPADYPVYGTLLEGNDIYKEQLSANGLIVMGNEGNGISPELRECVNRKLLIPCYQTDATHPDSLNVAVATAVTVAEFRRRMF